MATQLGIYNRALLALSQRRIASLTEPREPRRVLDDFYADCVQFCLEQGMWNFAMRYVALPSAIAGTMGYTYGFTKPVDLVHLFTTSGAASFDPPLAKDFIDQGGSWYANQQTLYLRYSSNDAAYGGNLALWTQSFTTYMAHVLAAWSATRITGSEAAAERMERRARRYLLSALAVDSVPMLPGKLPFNAEARGLTVETHQAQPIDLTPFHAPLVMGEGAPPPPAGQG